ncbi:hypothetical protein H4K36_00240 [Streptomyces sp. DHE7-1]|nr:hypothetical protein [Streptomyces sp. DHE7-1]
MPLSSRFTMPGQIRAVATSDPSGPLTVTGYGPNPLATVITRVDLSGKVEWQRTYPGTGKPQSRLATDGALWLAYPDCDSQLLEGVLPDGSTGPTARLECRADEEIGAFVLLDDGFVISWVSGSGMVRREGSRPISVPEPRVARYTREGECLWSTPIALGALSFPGVVEMGDRAGWEIRPRRPWVPKEIGIDHWEPLLVSADRIAASFTDTRGGIGRTFFLDLDSGATISVTAPAPTGRKAIAGPGQFLLGSQGYGAFTTGRFGRDGVESARWASHGAMLVGKNGGVCGPELENGLPSRSRFRRLAPDNSLVDGPPLTGYYTSYPAMDCEGTAVFWRDGKLLAVDTDLAGHELFAMDDSRAVIGRALLLSEGSVVVSLDNEVLVFRTPLGSLAEGPWPCGEANLRGNPLLS